jgi:hypothetical protein
LIAIGNLDTQSWAEYFSAEDWMRLLNGKPWQSLIAPEMIEENSDYLDQKVKYKDSQDNNEVNISCEQDVYLIRFIRNFYTHTRACLSHRLTHLNYFLGIFPTLVVDAWMVLQSDARYRDHPLLQEFSHMTI